MVAVKALYFDGVLCKRYDHIHTLVEADALEARLLKQSAEAGKSLDGKASNN